MKYFINYEEQQSSGSTQFVELMQGKYDGECWHENSIYMRAELWEKLQLTRLFKSVISEFDYYGINAMSVEQWEAIKNTSCDDIQRAAINEVASWVDECFSKHEYFTVLGL